MEGTNPMLHKLRAAATRFSRLRVDRGATDPMLAIGAVVLTLILVLGGTFLITNMVTSGRNLNATTDLDKIAVAESGYFTSNDTFTAYGSFGVNAPSAPLEDSSIGFRPTAGASVVAVVSGLAGAAEWAAAAESAASGNPIFIRTSESNKTVKLEGPAFTASAADLAELGLTTADVALLVSKVQSENQPLADQVAVTTLAGSTAGSADGTGGAAQFYGPFGVAVDSSGTVYSADYRNNRIRKITPAGVVTTLAGSGTAGSADGTGGSAQFYGPFGVAVDSSGTVYVGDRSNHRIRKITPAGVVTTLAGSGVAGFADGTGAGAQFNSPSGMAVDSSGTVYVADFGNSRIRKITPAGVVTTLAGSTAGFADGTGAAAQFKLPDDVAVDFTGTVYVADTYNSSIRKITTAGVVTTLAGSGGSGFADGTGSAAKFNHPEGVDVDPTGTVYVGDTANNRIRQITPAGVVATLAGSTCHAVSPSTPRARSMSPTGITTASVKLSGSGQAAPAVVALRKRRLPDARIVW